MEKEVSHGNVLKITRIGIGFSILIPLLIGYFLWLFSNVPIELGFLNKLLYLLTEIRQFDINHCIFCFMFEVIRWGAVLIMSICVSMVFPRYNWKAIVIGIIFFFVAINGRIVAYNVGNIIAGVIKNPNNVQYIWADKNRYKLPYDFFVEHKNKIKYIELYSEADSKKDIILAYKELEKQARDLRADGLVTIFGQTRDVWNRPVSKYGKQRAAGHKRVAFGTSYLNGNLANVVKEYEKKLNREDENTRLMAIMDIAEIDDNEATKVLLGIVKKRAAYGEDKYLDYIYALGGLANKKNEFIYSEILQLSQDKNSVDRAIRMLVHYPDKKETVETLEQIVEKTMSKITKIRAINAINSIEERAKSVSSVTQDQISEGQFKMPKNVTDSDIVYLDENAYRDAAVHETPKTPSLEKGKFLLKQGKEEEAIEQFLVAEKIGKKRTASMYLADAYEKIRNYDKALEYFLVYLDNYVSWQARERLFFRAKYLEEASNRDYLGAIETAEQGINEYCHFYNFKNPLPSDVERLNDLKRSKDYILKSKL